MIKISADDTLFDLVTAHDEIKDIMVELGFKDIVKPGILQSMGRVMTINKGSVLKKKDINEMIKVFAKHGYELVGGNE